MTHLKAMAARAKVLPHHVEQLAFLIEQLGPLTYPADMVVSRYFRAQPQLGNRDRALLAEASFTYLRRKSQIAQFAQSGQGPLGRRLALLALHHTFIDSDLGTGQRAESALADMAFVVQPPEIEWLQRYASLDRESLAPHIRFNLPEWLWQRMCAELSDEFAQSLAEAMLKSAPLDLRVNTLKAQAEDVMQQLNELGGRYQAVATPYAPDGLRLKGKPALQNQELFKKGLVEVQDEGSQLLAMLLAPKRGEMIVDFCAGAGGKTLALGAMMKSTGRLYALDVSEKRLANLKPRLARSGLSNVHPVWIDHENDVKVKRLAGKIDRVLVDAPCSGLGTLRRNPDLKWRQNPEAITQLHAKQLSILQSAARLPKIGGRLVYATCSFLQEENQAVVEAFLQSHPHYELLSPKDALKGSFPQHDGTPIGGEHLGYWQLWPQVHGTDGFFAAILQRKS
ncbi:RsmB/NOP family class I SAM-dependent RNA methyltransferase [Polynucleobacter sp. MWH-Loch1C5]|uniref:RsmB/NOP family class I SAM-dependent RNA methyltransferase n=1 Tax=Polynucleobacter sp. MWH-Loch1C5 TaxID=2689108 RepID=UPI001C0C1524|nr:RsmB/NOP family class I SAM-dependent RNA methyltransferase [Polynucleobacter sp. MWH-Loch1C5]